MRPSTDDPKGTNVPVEGVVGVEVRRCLVGRRLAPDVVRVEYENQEEGGGEKERAPGEGDGGGAKCRKECHQNEGKNLS